MATNIGPKIGIDGEADFKKEIASINQNLKTLGAEMDKTTSAFIGNEKSVEALTAQNDVLSSRMQVLSDKADIQKKRLEDLDKAGVDPTSKQYQKLLAELYNTEAQMNKTEAEITANTAAMDNLGKETEETSKETSTFGDTLKAILAAEAIKKGIKETEDKFVKVKDAVVAVSSAILAIPVATVKAFGTAITSATSAIAAQTRDTAAYADEIITLATNTGVSTDRLQEYKYMAELTDVSLETITGSLTSLVTKMDAARDGNDKATEAFAALGVSVTNTDGTLRDNEAVFKDAINALGQMEDGTERDAAAMAIFGKSAKELNPLIEMGSEGIAEFALEAHDAGAVLDTDTVAALGKADDAFQRFGGTVDALKNQIGAQFAEPVAEIMDGLTAVLQGDVDSGLEMIEQGIAKAAEIVDQLIPEATKLVTTLLNTLIDHLPDLIRTGGELLISIITGIAQALPELIPVVVDVILTLTDTLLQEDNLKLIIEAGIELIVQLAIGLAEAFPELVTAILSAIDVLLNTLWEHKDDLLDAGKDLIKGLWQGISDMGNWIKQKISGFMDGIVGSIKDFFGIASPSKLFEDEIGANLALGIGEGFENTMGTVERDMMAAIPSPSVPGVSFGDATFGTAYGATGPVEEITVPVTVDGVELARVIYRHIVGEGQRIGAAAIA